MSSYHAEYRRKKKNRVAEFFADRCSTEGCKYVRHSKGMCVRCYDNFKKKTDPRCKARTLARRRLNTEFINLVKEEPCMDCKNTFPPECMDFDHVRGEKRRNLAQSSAMSLESIVAEIKKCELVCANCHRIRTTARMRASGLKLAA